MKAYNLVPKTEIIADREIKSIVLGENGRGRKQTKILYKALGEFVIISIPTVGNPSIVDCNSNAGWLLRISTEGAYIRSANGNVSVNSIEGISVVARGHGAFGDAGRTGTWDDLLIAVYKEDAIFRVKPSRGDAHILLVQDGKIHKLSYVDAEALGLNLLGSGVSSKGEFVRL